ncbi:MAG: hypothetical protein QHI48_03380 [Bacteroidota bacterium]|nr:hypothetical protein [Bacteroidota bacterium]
MRRTIPATALAVLLLTAGNARLSAQSLPDLIENLGVKELARDYLRPAADAVGYSLNSGFFHSGRIEPKFHVWVGVKNVWIFIPTKDRTFIAKLPQTLTDLGYPAQVETATIAGEKGTVVHSYKTDPYGNPYPDFALPDGVKMENTFLVLPQISIGQIAATELLVRGIPPVTFEPGIGKIWCLGAGLRHSPTQYIELPFDLAFMAVAQRFEIGSIIDAVNLNANVHAGIPLGILEVFGGVGYESYSLTVSYKYSPTSTDLPEVLREPRSVELDFDRMNYRFTTGVRLILPLIDLTAEYSFGIQDNLTLGAGIRL